MRRHIHHQKDVILTNFQPDETPGAGLFLIGENRVALGTCNYIPIKLCDALAHSCHEFYDIY